MANTDRQESARKFHADDEISMDVVWTIVSWAWAKKYLLLAGVIIGGGIGLVSALTAPKTYTASVRILPSIDSSSAFSFPGLSSLGMGLGPVPTYEPMFEKIIMSDSILDGVLDTEWPTVEGAKVFLADIYSIYPETSEKREIVRAKEKLKIVFRGSAISFKRDQLTGFMELLVKVPKDPVVASGVANHLVGALQDILLQKHDNLTDSRRGFLEKRFLTVTEELLAAEEDLAVFEKTNRNYAQSPNLLREYSRLRREVDVYLIVWTEIQKQIELVQISNQHSSPRVVVIDPATPPVAPSGPKRRLMVMLGVFLGGVFMAVLILLFQVFLVARSKIMAGS